MRVADLDEVPGVVVDYLAAQNLPGRVVMAPHPELQAIPWSARPLLEVREGRAQGSDAVSVQHGFRGHRGNRDADAAKRSASGRSR